MMAWVHAERSTVKLVRQSTLPMEDRSSGDCA